MKNNTITIPLAAKVQGVKTHFVPEHACMLQEPMSSTSPTLPSCVHALNLNLDPCPQVALQAPHSDQSEQAASHKTGLLIIRWTFYVT